MRFVEDAIAPPISDFLFKNAALCTQLSSPLDVQLHDARHAMPLISSGQLAEQ